MSEMEPVRNGRFGAATPGARPSPPSLEALLSSPEPPPRGGWFTRTRIFVGAGIVVAAAAGFGGGHFTAGGPAPVRLTQLMVTDTALPAGARLTRAEMRAVPVQAGVSRPSGAMTPAAAGAMVGLVMRQAVPAGTFLERSLVTAAGALPNATHALVGLALKPGQLPAGGLSAGQQVLVVLLHTSSGGSVVQPQPLVLTSVWDLQGPGSSSAGSGATLATVVVPAREASVLSAYAAQGEVALVATAIPRGHAPTVIQPTPKPTPTPTPTPPPVTHRSTPKPSRKPAPHTSAPTPKTSTNAPQKAGQ